jgi:uncharacterized membrane protein YcaP (DUF421 family)
MGKRYIGKITAFNFVNYTVIGIIVTLISTNIITNFTFGIIALAVWTVVPIILDVICMKSKLTHDLLYGKEVVLIKGGKVMEENLNKARITSEDLLRGMRSKNAFSIADVEFAQLEATGDINVLLKSDKKPVTPYDLGKKVNHQIAPQTVIIDGNILEEPLSNMGLNYKWLNTELEKVGVTLDNVFIGQVNSSGELYLDLFDDNIEIPQPQVKEILYAAMEKCHADLISYSLETEDLNAKNMYLKNANKMEKLMIDLQPFLLR